jgi:Zn-dependent M28 family amino/carboxypeptidase
VQPEYTIVFAAWTAEEEGLLGSHYFVDHPCVPIENIQFYLNYDMISRNAPDDTLENKATLRYTQAYPEIEAMTRTHIEEYRLDLQPVFMSMEKPRGGSDFASFAAGDVPILTFNAGFTSDYHQISDHSSKADIGKMTDIIKVGFLNVWKIANTPDFRK